jgi:hypothetical protein
MTAVKYQVFVSSTFDDLKAERAEAVRAILELGHIPVGMEMFSAGDEEQWQVIARTIDTCDYYVVIVAHRYGSMSSGVSYTEREYDYAVSKKIPVLGFVIEASAPWNPDFVDKKKTVLAPLNAFKVKVKSKMVSFWREKTDLHGKIGIALVKAFSSSPRPGWIRATDAAGPQVVAELGRLSEENRRLRDQVDGQSEQASQESVRKYAALMERLGTQATTMPIWKDRPKSPGWADSREVTLADLFVEWSPILLTTAHASSLAQRTNALLNGDDFEYPTSYPDGHVERMLTDLYSFDLVEPVSNKGITMWRLSKLGQELLRHQRQTAIGHVTQTAEEPDEEESKG